MLWIHVSFQFEDPTQWGLVRATLVFLHANEIWLCWFIGTYFLGALHPLSLTHFLPPSPQGPLDSEGTDLMSKFQLGLTIPRSHILQNVGLWVSIFVLICWKRKPLWWWQNKTLINECSRILSEVIYHYILKSHLGLYYFILTYLWAI